MGCSFHLAAKEYSIETVLRAGGELDDNVQLQEDEITIAGLVVSPEIKFGVRTERAEVALNTALDFARFDKSEYNSDDQDVALTSSYAFEYNVFNAAAQLTRDSTRTSEAVSSGEFGEAARRESQNFSLGWQHLLTDKQSLELSVNSADVEYSSRNSNLSDYGYRGVNIAYSIALSDRIRVFTQLEASRFDSDTFRIVQFGNGSAPQFADFFPAESQSDTYGVIVGIERVLTEKLLYSIAVGANYVESNFNSVTANIIPTQLGLNLITGLEDEDDTSFSFQASLSYQGERSTLDVNLSSNTNPGSNGYLLLINQLRFDFDFQLSERSSVFSKLELIDSESLRDTVDSLGRQLGSNERTYGMASVGASYRLTRAWYISASYRYRAQERESFADIAQSNALVLKIAYKPFKNTWSR